MLLLAALSQISILAVLLSLVGQPLSRLVPGKVQSVGHFFGPVLALCVFILLSVAYGWLSSFKFSVSLTIGTLALILSLLFSKCRITALKNSFWFLGFVIIASTPILGPLMLFDSFNPFNDTFTYLVHGQWLQTHSFAETVLTSGNFPAETQVALYQNAGHRMGGSFFLAFIQSLFRLEWSYYTYVPVVCTFFCVGCYSVAGVLEFHFGLERYKALMLALLPAFSFNGFVFGAQYGFLPQTVGLSVFMAFICFSYFYLVWMPETRLGVRQLFVHLLPLSLLIATILFCYNDMFPFVAGGSFLLILAFLYRVAKVSLNLLNSLVIVFLQVAVFVNVEGLRIIKNFIDTVLNAASGAVVFGWPVDWDVIQFYAFSLGLKSPFGHGQYKLDTVLSVWAMPIILGILAITINKVRVGRGGKILFDLFLSFNALALFLFIKFRYFTTDIAGQQGHTFLQFKLASWLGAVNLFIFSVLLAWIYQKIKIPEVIKNVTVLGLFAISASIHIFIAAPNYTHHFLAETGREKSAFNFFTELRQKLEPISKEEVVYLGVPHEHHKLTQMIAYILHDRKLAGKYEDGYLRGTLPEAERDMGIDVADWLIEHRPRQTSDEKQLNRHGALIISERPFNVSQRLGHVGGYATESSGGNQWNWVKDEITHSFQLLTDKTEVTIRFDYLLNGSNRQMHVVLEDASKKQLFEEYFEMKPGWGVYNSRNIKVTSQLLNLRVVASGEPIKLSETDSRETKFLLQNAELLFPN